MPKAKAAQANINTEAVTMAALTHLLESHRTAISDDFKQTLSALETKLNGVLTTVTEHAEKLEILESEGDAREVCLKAANEAITKLQRDHAKFSNQNWRPRVTEPAQQHQGYRCTRIHGGAWVNGFLRRDARVGLWRGPRFACGV